ncbi:glucose-6-phosphate isomerase, partial [Leucobacter sp. M11]|uniref:glucose-6-phosphate isomerase n=1 Tax=Leucobacter sp. M11 TaxID=2993565 RepID=UPI002D7E8868
AASRLFAADAVLWGPEAESEAAVRLGWIDAPAHAGPLVAEITELRDALRARGISRFVLCGMGGSSLAPEMMTAAAGVALTVLDSTHPAQVRETLSAPLAETVAVFSSKSGSTVETLSHHLVFRAAFAAAGVDPAEHIVIVTDPGSPLQALAEEHGYRVFLADPNVGGRYSALTAFGLVPAGLAGADIAQLTAEAGSVRDLLARDEPENPALLLAAALCQGVPERPALFLIAGADAGSGLGDWIEQLVAESTGKHGLGVLPVVLGRDDPEAAPAAPALAGLRAWLPPHAPAPAPAEAALAGPLGAQLLLWETATALAGVLLGTNPFDQPDVERAKIAARAALSGEDTDDADDAARPLPVSALADGPLADLLASIPPHGYLAVQAYLPELTGAAGERLTAALHELRRALFLAGGRTVTLGQGPRFLHSTGQFHKGGPETGAFLQLLDRPEPDLDVPGTDYSFGELLQAQASGDAAVLRAHGLPVFRVRLGDPLADVAALTALAESLARGRAS